MKVYFLLIVFFLSIGETLSQVEGQIAINGRKTVTNHPEKLVTISIKYRNATEMLLSNSSSFEGARWERVLKTRKSWHLSGEDGLKTVYAKFRDAKGNISEEVSARIELDRIPPLTPEFIVNYGLPYSNKKDRTTHIQIEGEEIVRMRISNRADFLNAPWVEYKQEFRDFKVSAGDGKKNVYAQFADFAGNITEVVSGSFIVDTKAPTGTKVIINKGKTHTTSRGVQLDIIAAGAREMIIRKPGAEWQPFQQKLTHTLSQGDGEKRVYMKFRDLAGNTSPVIYDGIVLDTKPPTRGIITLNNDSRYVRKFDAVNIKLIALGASEMMLSKDPNFQGVNWLAYKTFISGFTLDDADGEQTVYAKFRDLAGNVSEACYDKIILDTQPPSHVSVRISAPNAVYDENKKITIVNDNRRIVNLKLSAKDARYMMISNVSNFYSTKWEVYKPGYQDWELAGDKDGERFVFVKFRDRAGNVSKIASDKVIVDTSPPVDPKISINSDEQFAISRDGKVKLGLFVRGASHMMISNNPSFENVRWELYQSTKRWKLDSEEDGIKSVFVKFKDIANNESQVVVDNIILDTEPPQDCSVLINKGNKITNNLDRLVILRTRAKEARLMQVSNSSNFEGSRWMGYSTLNVKWKLSDPDGKKNVYVRFKDEAGNISATYQDDIYLDRSPPKQGTVTINSGKQITNNVDKEVTLSLYAEGVYEMKISNRYDFKDAEWEAYQTTKKWTLRGSDGLKIVYVKFRDKIKNESRVAYDRIGVDTQAPTSGKVEIERNAEYTTNINKYVRLRLFARKANEMKIGNEPDFKDSEWIKYQPFYENWILDGDDGEKTVYVTFKDKAGNETKPVSDKIILDRQEPFSEEILINNGAEFINDKSATVNLVINVEDADQMMISNDKRFREVTARWVSYRPATSWKLPLNPEGTKRVYVKFKDKAGNESAVAYDDILIDTQPPSHVQFRILGNKTGTEDPNINLQIHAKEAEYMMLSNNANFSGAKWETYSKVKKWTLPSGEGLKKIYIRLKDRAENVSTSTFVQITLFKPRN